MSTAEERLKILNMIAEKKISAEEGAQLLSALQTSDRKGGSSLSGEARYLRIKVTNLTTGVTAFMNAAQLIASGFAPPGFDGRRDLHAGIWDANRQYLGNDPSVYGIMRGQDQDLLHDRIGKSFFIHYAGTSVWGYRCDDYNERITVPQWQEPWAQNRKTRHPRKQERTAILTTRRSLLKIA